MSVPFLKKTKAGMVMLLPRVFYPQAIFEEAAAVYTRHPFTVRGAGKYFRVLLSGATEDECLEVFNVLLGLAKRVRQG